MVLSMTQTMDFINLFSGALPFWGQGTLNKTRNRSMFLHSSAAVIGFNRCTSIYIQGGLRRGGLTPASGFALARIGEERYQV